MANLLACLALCFAMFLRFSAASSHLRVGFYERTCPPAEALVKSAVEEAHKKDPSLAAGLIRMHFHDCFVGGCDASVLIDSTRHDHAEKESPRNQNLRGFEIIDKAKAMIEAQCQNIVSCADIVAFAARDAVHGTGGRHYDVQAGRRDGRVSLRDEATKNLPDGMSNVTQLRLSFSRKGLSLKEMVILSGAHTVGVAHCSSSNKRLYSFSSKHSQDPSLDGEYAQHLKSICPRPSNNSKSPEPAVPMDPFSPTFDNNYYKILKNKKGLLFSDQVLWSNILTGSMVRVNANNPKGWAVKFGKAMVHMGSIGVLTGHQGEIRKNCRKVN